MAFSQISNDDLTPIVSKLKTEGVQMTKNAKKMPEIHNYSPIKFWQTMIKCSFCVFLILLLLYLDYKGIQNHIWILLDR